MSAIESFSASGWIVTRGNAVRIGPFDLKVMGGEIITFMGPSGIGKTTMLLSLLGYSEPGLDIGGRRMQEGKTVAPGSVPRGALYVPQAVPFNPNWEVGAFLSRLPWGERGWRSFLPAVRRRRAEHVKGVLKRLGLVSRMRATVSELSGGEAQRAALAQLLLLKPRLVVCDEFVSALDPGMSLEILEQFREMITHTGGAALVALHDVHAAMHVSNRIALLWPSHIDAQPWVVEAGMAGWQSDVIHTILCLARWTTEYLCTPPLKHMVSLLRSFLNDPQSVGLHLLPYGAARAVSLDDDGFVREADVSLLSQLRSQLDFDEETAMSPVRVSGDESASIGFTIPIGETGARITVVASSCKPR